MFREPFRRLTEARLPPMVLDGEITVADDRGITHLNALSEAIREGDLGERRAHIFRLLRPDQRVSMTRLGDYVLAVPAMC